MAEQGVTVRIGTYRHEPAKTDPRCETCGNSPSNHLMCGHEFATPSPETEKSDR